ncbi:MAG: oxidoreductase [Thaumarchaeota archaeon]|jgi:coenzyme F420-reducing hydrogenase gamma subunit|nr:oxidoreductase [Nitrososphaerota archaeon]
MVDKLKVGVFKLTSCSGCQMVLVHLEESLLEVLKHIDLKYFRMVSDDDLPNEPLDAALVEGAVTNEEEAAMLKKIRRLSRFLVATGACAATGGVNAMKNITPEGEVESIVYSSPEYVRSGKAFGLNEYVKVDAYLYGCPIDRNELVNTLMSLVLRVPPYIPGLTVCMECKMKGNECVFLTRREPCLGPVTVGGCGALCPSNNVACEGCRGVLKGTNVNGLVSAWEKAGVSPELIRIKLRKYTVYPVAGR